MKFAQARQLHNGDEITIKETGEIVQVITAYTDYVGDKLEVFVEVYSGELGYTKLSHREIA